jgi:hypothetical protein
MREWKTRALILARKRHGNNGSGPFIKNILAENENRALA